MSEFVQRQRQLRDEAKERQSQTLPNLKTALREARRTCSKRLQQARDRCAAAMAEHRREVAADRAALRAWSQETRAKALAAYRLLKSNMRIESLDEVDAALKAVEEQRVAIERLRQRVASMGDPRDQGGRRGAEVLEEAYDEVRRNIGDDPVIIMAFERVKHQLRPSQGRTLTELFFDHIRSKPAVLADCIAKLEQQWTVQAEYLVGRLSKVPPSGEELRSYLADLDVADRHLSKL